MKRLNRNLFALSILFVLAMTVFPPYSSTRHFNRVMFDSYEVAWRAWHYNGSLRYFTTNILGNLILFIPFGYFGKLTGRKHIVVLGLIFSVIVEAAQYPLGRWTDVDDVVLNTLGTAIGLSLAVLWRFSIKRRIGKR
jgi:glycopeptide antibiotics resistance protein